MKYYIVQSSYYAYVGSSRLLASSSVETIAYTDLQKASDCVTGINNMASSDEYYELYELDTDTLNITQIAPLPRKKAVRKKATK